MLTYPLMVGIQMVNARMGRVTGRGLAANVARRFPSPILYSIVALLGPRTRSSVIAVPIIAVMMLIANDRKVMGAFVVKRRLKVLGWLATCMMAAAVVAMFVA